MDNMDAEARLGVCAQCSKFNDLGICTECGCVMAVKVHVKTAKCPLGNWY